MKDFSFGKKGHYPIWFSFIIKNNIILIISRAITYWVDIPCHTQY